MSREITIRVESGRQNSLGSFLGFSPSHPTKKVLAKSRQEFKGRVRVKRQEFGDEMRRLRKSAQGRTAKTRKLERLFHEIYGPQENPTLADLAALESMIQSKHRMRKRNPSAAELRETFTGKEVDRVTIHNEPHMPKGDYALIGRKIVLYVKPMQGGQVMRVELPHALAVSDESGRRIWFVGGDQDVSESLHVFGARQREAGLYVLGQARRIDYTQRKEHAPDPEVDGWRHDFGEENGSLPAVLFDANHRRLLLEGGDYVIRREGIVN